MVTKIAQHPGIRRADLSVRCSNRDRAILREVLRKSIDAGFVIDDGANGLRMIS